MYDEAGIKEVLARLRAEHGASKKTGLHEVATAFGVVGEWGQRTGQTHARTHAHTHTHTHTHFLYTQVHMSMYCAHTMQSRVIFMLFL